MKMISYILCLENANREKFSVLKRSAIGWPVDPLRFASNDLLCFRMTQVHGTAVIVIVGDFTAFEAPFPDHSGQVNYVISRLIEQGVDQKNIIVLNGDETPEGIDGLVRDRFVQILAE